MGALEPRRALVYGEVTLGEEGVTTQVRLTWDAPAEGVEWIRGYEVQRATCNGGFATLVSDTGSTATAYTDADVEAGESYTYRVRARRPQGLSLTSNSWTLLTPGGTGESDCAVPAGAPEPEPVEGEDVTYAFSQHVTEVVLVKNTGQSVQTALALSSNVPKRAQAFTTGANTAGYTLGSIGFNFGDIADTSTAGGELTVTLNKDDNGDPGDALCTLNDPESFTLNAVNTFDAPTTGTDPCPTLAANTAYFVVIERVTITTSIALRVTTSTNEDTGGSAGWSIGNERKFFLSGSWDETASESYQIEVRGAAGVVTLPPVVVTPPPVVETGQVFNTLDAAGNNTPTGLWSDGSTMWVADFDDSKIYAYDMATKARVEDKEFDTLASSSSQEDDNSNPKGIWSDGATMWVSDENATRVFAYDMTTKARVKAKEFRVPARVVFTQLGSHLETDSRFQDIWSDGNGTMWLVSDAQNSAYAYRIDTGNPVPSENLLVGPPYLQAPFGIWGDDQSIWLADTYQTGGTLHAFWRFTKAAQPGRDIQLDTENNQATGLWSDGATMWVADWYDSKIYAYPIPAAESPLAFTDRLSVERVTDTTAIVALDLRGLPFAGERKAVSISINFGGATIYAHPDAGTARFMLRGLEPETQYTVSGKFDVQPSHHLGRVIFRTDYARLAGVENLRPDPHGGHGQGLPGARGRGQEVLHPLLGEPRRIRARCTPTISAQAQRW